MTTNSSEAQKKIIKKLSEKSDRAMLDVHPIFSTDVFKWGVAASGHHWVTIDKRMIGKLPGAYSPDVGARLLTTGIPVNERSVESNRYRPLAQPLLLSEFLETKPTEGAICSFANKWGMLGEKRRLFQPNKTDSWPSVQGESFTVWKNAIEELNRAVQLWKWARADDHRALQIVLQQRLYNNEHDPEWIYQDKPGEADILGKTPFPRSDLSSIIFVAKLFVQKWINARISAGCAPRILWHLGDQRHVVRIMPSSLLSALWWQFARICLGDIEYRLCSVCKRPMEISREDSGFRIDRKFCSRACRQKDHRLKVRKVKEMHKKGVAIPEIAERMETTKTAVKHWISKKK